MADSSLFPRRFDDEPRAVRRPQARGGEGTDGSDVDLLVGRSLAPGALGSVEEGGVLAEQVGAVVERLQLGVDARQRPPPGALELGIERREPAERRRARRGRGQSVQVFANPLRETFDVDARARRRDEQEDPDLLRRIDVGRDILRQLAVDDEVVDERARLAVGRADSR